MAIITITGTFKSGQKQLALNLSEKLNYKAYSKEIIDICARKYNILHKDLLDELENVPGLWKRLTGKQHRELIYFKCALLDVVKEDNIIYYGPYGQLFLSEFDNVLKLFIDMPFEHRISSLIQELNISREEAIDKIKEIDQSSKKLVQLLYDVDYKDLSLYDLSINLDKIQIDTATDLIINLLNSGSFRTTENALNKIKMISLENEIKAAIAADEQLWDQQIFVEAKGNKIIISGTVKNEKLKKDLIETVNQVKDLRNVEFFVGTLSEPIRIKPFTSS